MLDDDGQPLVCTVEIAAEPVSFRAWVVNVGRCPVYLIDANLPTNQPHFRDLTRRVYGGDNSTRIMQEILLGVGGVRLLRRLGVEPSVFHMNEGHAAFLALELMREQIAGVPVLTRRWPGQGGSACSRLTRRCRPVTIVLAMS